MAIVIQWRLPSTVGRVTDETADETQEDRDRQALCDALAMIMAERKLKIRDVAKRLNEPESNVRRMTLFQEPKLTFIAKFERAYGIPKGSVLTRAKLVSTKMLPEELILTDERILPSYQEHGAEMIGFWVARSAEERSKAKPTS